jgi:hypothetical protein
MIMFSKTQTLEKFAEVMNITSLELKVNEKTGKRFADFGNGITARVSEKVSDDLDGELSVSWFAPEDGDSSWMLHPTGQSNVKVLGKRTFGVKHEAQL